MKRALGPGTVIAGRYRIVREIGRGGMGIVYRARPEGGGDDVALKVLSPHLMGKESAVVRFEREARVSMRVRHPHIVPVFDTGRAGEALWLTMGLLRGRSLRDRLDALRGDGLDQAEAVQIGRQVADALAAASAERLIHRDIKPENIFLETVPGDPLPRAVVVDFGLALPTDDPDGRLTTEGIIFGTPAYMSPEQARSEDLGGATDIYALGCVLYECICGQPPFPGGGLPVITRHLFTPPPSLAVKAPNADPRLIDLVHRMLRKAAVERPTALDARHALDVIARGPRGDSGGTRVGRAARMVDKATSRLPSVSHGMIAVRGELEEMLRHTLVANGLILVSADDRDAADADITLALDAPVALVASMVASGQAVIADTPSADVDRMAALLRVGAAGVLKRGSGVEDVLRTLRRAIKRARRRR